MIGGGTAASVSAAAPLATSLPVELSAADRARVDKALRDSRAGNTRAQYRSAWRGWSEWAALAGHQALPADPLTVAAYLAERVADGAAAATVRTIRAAIRAGHVDTGADDPTGHDGVRRVLQGLTRQAAGRGRGQADPLTTDAVVVEGEFGIGKPEPAVFRHALAAVGRQPHEAWMVGDDLAKDIAGGDAAGLHTVWVDSRHEGLPEAPAAHPHRIVHAIAELLPAVTSRSR